MYLISLESCDIDLSNSICYMLVAVLHHEIWHDQCKPTKHLNSFDTHCIHTCGSISTPALHSAPHQQLDCLSEHYDLMWTIKHLHRSEDQLLSFDHVKWCIHWLSGIMLVEHNICVNSCLAYTKPHEHLDTSSHCSHLDTVLALLDLRSISQLYQWGLLFRLCTAHMRSQNLCTIRRTSSQKTWLMLGSMVVYWMSTMTWNLTSPCLKSEIGAV